MKKLLALLVLSVTFSCSDDPELIVREIDAFQQSLIPFQHSEVLTFTSETNEILSVDVSGKILDNSYTIESGDDYILNTLHNTYKFSDGREFIIWVGRTTSDLPTFDIVSYLAEDYSQTEERLSLNACSIGINDLESYLTDVTISELEYTDVFKFDSCPDYQISLSRIIYSVKRGIEYIEFEDGRFFKQL